LASFDHRSPEEWTHKNVSKRWTATKKDAANNPEVLNQELVSGEANILILKWIFKEQDGKFRLDSSGSGQGQVVGSFENDNEPSGSIKCGEILD
jgi:hypothetical protein